MWSFCSLWLMAESFYFFFCLIVRREALPTLRDSYSCFYVGPLFLVLHAFQPSFQAHVVHVAIPFLLLSPYDISFII